MSKKNKLGRSFDAIIDDETNTSHKNIIDHLVTTSDQEDTAPLQEINQFIWYQGKDNISISGLARACRIWDTGIIIETTKSLPSAEIITITTLNRSPIHINEASVEKTLQTGEGIYEITLNLDEKKEKET